MRCYCIVEHGQPLQALELPVPQPTGSEVLLRTVAAGVCHTDLHLHDGYYDLGGGKRMLFADRGILTPITPGHEVCAEVVAAGADAGEVPRGQTVLLHPWIGCGECAACRRGQENLCNKPLSLGINRPGGFAEYLLVPHPRYLIDIEGLDPAQAAPLACAGVTTFSALRKFGVRIQEAPVLIIGAGGLGLMALSILKAMGGVGAIVADIDPLKRAAALAAGALQAVDAAAPDAHKQIIAATDGGAASVLDLVGATATQNLAQRAVARGGQIVIVGLMGGDITLSLPMVVMRPLAIQGSFVGTLAELRELVALVKKTRMPPIPIVRRPFSEANAALQDLHAGRIIGRVVLQP